FRCLAERHGSPADYCRDRCFGGVQITKSSASRLALQHPKLGMHRSSLARHALDGPLPAIAKRSRVYQVRGAGDGSRPFYRHVDQPGKPEPEIGPQPDNWAAEFTVGYSRASMRSTALSLS